ncbi:hypothetical protein TERTU_0287 [Teredinibacter turnerae T7901]|uniref:Uncharacterized protein n=1 Tax=Teredinibacter turnerae (strain ATCC 39867 / T7901) TaxID=377629 RepID=C5BM35_TERTT|nr:hypothetical protein TERTU_0287 [Teredinibacter turnerae T7901]
MHNLRWVLSRRKRLRFDICRLARLFFVGRYFEMAVPEKTTLSDGIARRQRCQFHVNTLTLLIFIF